MLILFIVFLLQDRCASTALKLSNHQPLSIWSGYRNCKIIENNSIMKLYGTIWNCFVFAPLRRLSDNPIFFFENSFLLHLTVLNALWEENWITINLLTGFNAKMISLLRYLDNLRIPINETLVSKLNVSFLWVTFCITKIFNFDVHAKYLVIGKNSENWMFQ